MQPTPRELELQQQLKETQRKLAEATTKPTTAAGKAKAEFKLPEGEGHYTHVYVTHKNGVELPVSQVEPFHPNVWRQLAKSPNIIKGEVLHAGK